MFDRLANSRQIQVLIQICTMVFFVLNYSCFTKSCFYFVRKVANDRRSNSICNLATKDSSWSSRSLDNSFEEEEKIVEPACSYKIINKMSNSISPDLNVCQRIKSSWFFSNIEKCLFMCVCFAYQTLFILIIFSLSHGNRYKIINITWLHQW